MLIPRELTLAAFNPQKVNILWNEFHPRLSSRQTIPVYLIRIGETICVTICRLRLAVEIKGSLLELETCYYRACYHGRESLRGHVSE